MNQLECFEDAYKSDKIKFTNLFCLRAIITNEKETKTKYKVQKKWRILMHLSWTRNNYIITYPRVGILGVDECWFLHKLHWPKIVGVFVQFATESCRQGCCFNFDMKHDANRPVNYMRYPQDRSRFVSIYFCTIDQPTWEQETIPHKAKYANCHCFGLCE